ncbi:periplasmic heavy metal sensor [Roseomonas sp. BN140053]|uniref:periplasmic heavy metal sensor n=1 Tax=Roseomonas sp. BN140053 TaxID=3391898 RepID=UPI0039EB8C4B
MRLSAPLVLRIALGASLALNLVLGAFLAWPGPVRGGGGPWRLQARMERALSGPDRDIFHREMEAGRARTEAALRGMRQAREPIEAAMRREPFDPAALGTALAAARGRWQEFSIAFENELLRAVGAISPDGRRRLADDMPRRRE